MSITNIFTLVQNMRETIPLIIFLIGNNNLTLINPDFAAVPLNGFRRVKVSSCHF